MNIVTKITTKGCLVLSITIILWILVAIWQPFGKEHLLETNALYLLIACFILKYVYKFGKRDVYYVFKGENEQIVKGNELSELTDKIFHIVKSVKSDQYQIVNVVFLGVYRKGVAYQVILETCEENLRKELKITNDMYKAIMNEVKKEISLPIKIVFSVNDRNILQEELVSNAI